MGKELIPEPKEKVAKENSISLRDWAAMGLIVVVLIFALWIG